MSQMSENVPSMCATPSDSVALKEKKQKEEKTLS